MTESRLDSWIIAARPKTLWAGISPVLIGAAMAYESGGFHWPSAVCAMVSALLLQVAANFANEYFDFVKGVGSSHNGSGGHVTQAGFTSAEIIKWASVGTFLLAFLPGIYIVWRGGWLFLVMGLLAICFAMLYLGGPYPLGRLGMGDFLVLIFFGPLAVGGTYYIQTQGINGIVVLAGFAPGAISMALFAVSNIRDIKHDNLAGKPTLAVRFGRGFAELEYVTSLVTGMLIVPVALCIITWGHLWCLLSILVLLATIPSTFTVFMKSDEASLNKALSTLGKMNLAFSVIFSLLWIM